MVQVLNSAGSDDLAVPERSLLVGVVAFALGFVLVLFVSLAFVGG